jgi:hypothetical protein
MLLLTLYCYSKHCAMMSHLCNRRIREFLILARTWLAFGLPSKTGCDITTSFPDGDTNFTVLLSQLTVAWFLCSQFIPRMTSNP